MAVLFVMHIPCDDQGDDDDAPGNAGQAGPGESGGSTADEGRSGTGTCRAGDSSAVPGFTGGGGDGIRAAKSSSLPPLPGSQSAATVVSFRPGGEGGDGRGGGGEGGRVGGEQRPLLLTSGVPDHYVKKNSPRLQAATVSSPQRSLLCGDGRDDDLSVGKFTVSRVSTLPGGGGGAGANGGQQRHDGVPNEARGGLSCCDEVDISTEVITLREVRPI